MGCLAVSSRDVAIGGPVGAGFTLSPTLCETGAPALRNVEGDVGRLALDLALLVAFRTFGALGLDGSVRGIRGRSLDCVDGGGRNERGFLDGVCVLRGDRWLRGRDSGLGVDWVDG